MSNEARANGPVRRSDCLRTAGITCLVLVVVGAGIALWIAGMVYKNPTMKRVYNSAQFVAQCQMNLQHPNNAHGQSIGAALERYVRRNGEYPASLADLYPDFLEDRSVLHCPADERPEDVVSYEYIRPKVDDPGGTIVVRCKRHVVIEGQPPVVLMLDKDGRIKRQGYERITQPAESR